MIESKEENDLRSQSVLVSEEQNKMKSNEVLDFASIVAKGTPRGTELENTLHI